MGRSQLEDVEIVKSSWKWHDDTEAEADVEADFFKKFDQEEQKMKADSDNENRLKSMD